MEIINKLAKVFTRNEFGLVDDPSVKYVFNEDGTINWRAMIAPEHLVPNKQNFERRGQPVPDKIDGLEDRDLIILLAGIKKNAALRGFTSVTYDVHSPSSDYVVATCTIKWIPNYESENREVTFSAIGDASPRNTSGFGAKYLGPIAENRAFVRCVRNFLKINIVSQEEIGGADVTEENPLPANSCVDPYSLLEKTMSEKKVTFVQMKKKLVAEGFEGAEAFEKIKDIPRNKTYDLISRLKAIEAK